MADRSAPNPVSELRRVHENVTGHGFALTTEWDIGLPVKCAKNLRETYFDGGQLRHDEGDRPHDRERARDVILYEWNNGKLILEEYETIAIWDRSGIKGERIHKRIELLQDPQAREFIETFLSLVPEKRRQPRGTFGVNLFRTHTDVVSKPHQDEEEFIFLYVLDREGDGAVSYLYNYDKQNMGAEEIGGQILRKQLNPGDLMIFEDRRFKHGATPLTPPPGGRAKRDVLVCTVDFSTTYLKRHPVSS
jgi:2-oxoglutarate-Fe(II)-dependent dioxygenase family protein